MARVWQTTQQIGRKLLALGLGFDYEDHYGKAFIIAADTGDLDKMLEHISLRGVSYQDEYGQRPLHRASRRGHAAAVRMLLEYGSDPNATDHVGAYTAVQYAAHYQHSEVVRLLVSYGADVFYQNRLACRPATYYAHKYATIRTAIQQGLSDLYIHRSIAASFFIELFENDTKTQYFGESLTLQHSIAMIIIEFIPRHQFPTTVKTRYITNNTQNWHSSDLFSEKHLEIEKKNYIHSCKYNGEFDIDSNWHKIQKMMQQQQQQQQNNDDSSSESENDDDSDYDGDYYTNTSDDEEEEDEDDEKYRAYKRDQDEDDNYSTTSHSISYSYLTKNTSLSDDDVGNNHNDITSSTSSVSSIHHHSYTNLNWQKRTKKKKKRKKNRRNRHNYPAVNNHHVNNHTNFPTYAHGIYFNQNNMKNVALLLLSILIILIALCITPNYINIDDVSTEYLDTIYDFIVSVLQYLNDCTIW